MPWTVNPDHGYLERFDTGASIDAVLAVNVDAATPPGTDPVVPDGSGVITVTGGQVASGTTANVIRTHSTAANQYVTEIQQTGTSAAQDTTLNGVAHFDSAFFTAVNGFVSLTGAPMDNLTITPNVGGAVSPVLDNINLFGEFADTVETVVTHNIAGDLKIEDRTWFTQYVVDPSATVGLRGTFQTIQAAIDQAVADGMSLTNFKEVYIRNGTYVEDLTIYSGLILKGEAIQADPSALGMYPEIRGNHTLDAIAIFYVEGLYFNNNTASDPTFSAAGTACIPFARNCTFSVATGTGRHYQSINFSNGVFRDCSFWQTSYQEGFSISAATWFYNCTFQSTGFATTNVLRFYECNTIGPVVCTNGQVKAYNSSFSSNTTDNISGTGSGELKNCLFSSNLATTVAVSATGGTWYLNNISRSGSFTGPTDLYTTGANPSLDPALSGNIYKGLKTAINYIIIDDYDFYVGVTDTSAPRTISLPQKPALDAVYIIKDESGGAGTNNITVDTVGAPLIDGAATKVINTNYACYAFKFDGTNYYILWSFNELEGETITGDTGGALSPDASGNWNILGTSTAAGTTPVSTSGSGNTLTIQVQKTQSIAATDATKIGLAAFDSTDFSVDANGFVTLNGTGAGQTITGDTGGALTPTAGNWNILGTSTAAGTTPVQTSGSGSTLTVQVQKTQSIAATDATKIGLAAFDSTDFSVDANGFVTLNGTGAGQTITGNTGGAISPVAGNWDIVTDYATVLFKGTAGTETLDFSGDSVNNVVMGSSLPSVSTGLGNTGVGFGTLDSITSGLHNTTLGYAAMNLHTIAKRNTAIGHNAMSTGVGNADDNTAVGDASCQSISDGDFNTAVGSLTLSGITTGSRNVAIGYGAGSSHTTSDSSNIEIYNTGVAGESNKIRIGTQGTGAGQQSDCYLAGALHTTSGRIVKTIFPGAYPYTALTTDYIIFVDTASARTVNLLASPETGRTYRIKDYVGSAATNNITVSGNGNNIDGSSTYLITIGYDSIDLVYNGTEWNIL